MALKITKDSCFIRAIDTDGEVLPIVYNQHFIRRNFYENHPNLKELEIGEGIVEIGEGAFEGCTSLTSVKLPASLKLIRQDAFAGCTSLQKVILDESVTDIDCWMSRRMAKVTLIPPCNENFVKHLVGGHGEIDIRHRGEYDPHYWDQWRNKGMDVLTVIGIIVLIILAFVCFGLLGWVLKAFGWVFDFLQEGCSTSLGCLFWVFIVLFLLLGMLTM